MSEAAKKIRDLERALRREKENTVRVRSERDAALREVEQLHTKIKEAWMEGSSTGWKAARGER